MRKDGGKVTWAGRDEEHGVKADRTSDICDFLNESLNEILKN